MSNFAELDEAVLTLNYGKAVATQRNAKYGVLLLRRYLAAQGILKLLEFDMCHARAFLAWIPGGAAQVRSYGSMALRAIHVVKQLHPELVNPEYEYQPNLLPTIPKTYTRTGERVSKRDYQEIITACLADIQNNSDDYIPYVVLMAAYTGLNTVSILTLTQECIEPLSDEAYFLHYTKRRAGGEQRLKLSTPNVRDIVTAWRKHSKTKLLFVESDEKLLHISRQLASWRKAHKLRKFSLGDFRPLLATVLYEQTKNIFSVQQLLNHKEVTTTVGYLQQDRVDGLHVKEIVAAQNKMYERLFNGK